MPTKDPRLDAYIAKSAPFARPILRHLRRIVHAACPEVEETMKWSMPFFLHRGILCHMAAFKHHCAFGFWNRASIPGPGKGAGNDRDDALGQFGRITAISDLPDAKRLIRQVKKAAQLNEVGVKSSARQRPNEKKELAIPADLLAALRTNRQAQATFDKFGYSHKKEYVEWITGAKRGETRARRLETALTWLSEGKPRNWKYINC